MKIKLDRNGSRITRRRFVKLAAAGATAIAGPPLWLRPARAGATVSHQALAEFGYGDVTISSERHEAQLRESHDVLMSLSEDSLLKPLRQMAGQAAPGEDLGGWYNYDPDYDWHKDDAGFAPGATFGQWISALARYHAITGAQETRAKVLRLNRLYAQTICENFFASNRFPAYCYDKLVQGLIDSQRFAGDPDAFALLDRTTSAAVPHLPGKAIDRERAWRPDRDQSFRWDESYTIPESLFLAYQRGAGDRYRDLGTRYLDDPSWFDPLARGENVLGGKHAYSYVNSLSSALQAYLTLGSKKHLLAASNAFAMLSAQSFATGGWGPDEMLLSPEGDDLHASLAKTHNSFEVPCGSYAHFKATRYLLRVTRDSRYGDSMERVMYNTVLGAKTLRPDGRAFYYADYNFSGRKVYSNHVFPCCSGTLPQVAADYRINAYFRDPLGIYVNLYLPSKVRWVQDGVKVSLSQTGWSSLHQRRKSSRCVCAFLNGRRARVSRSTGSAGPTSRSVEGSRPFPGNGAVAIALTCRFPASNVWSRSPGTIRTPSHCFADRWCCSRSSINTGYLPSREGSWWAPDKRGNASGRPEPRAAC
jgi:uncharacterized protein